MLKCCGKTFVGLGGDMQRHLRTLIILIVLTVTGCGPSQEEINTEAAVACSILSETRNMDAAIRVEKINNFRRQFDLPPYLDGDDAFQAMFGSGMCEELLKNKISVQEEMPRLRAICNEEAAAKQEAKTKEVMSQEGVSGFEISAELIEEFRKGVEGLVACAERFPTDVEYELPFGEEMAIRRSYGLETWSSPEARRIAKELEDARAEAERIEKEMAAREAEAERKKRAAEAEAERKKRAAEAKRRLAAAESDYRNFLRAYFESVNVKLFLQSARFNERTKKVDVTVGCSYDGQAGYSIWFWEVELTLRYGNAVTLSEDGYHSCDGRGIKIGVSVPRKDVDFFYSRGRDASPETALLEIKKTAAPQGLSARDERKFDPSEYGMVSSDAEMERGLVYDLLNQRSISAQNVTSR